MRFFVFLTENVLHRKYAQAIYVVLHIRFMMRKKQKCTLVFP